MLLQELQSAASSYDYSSNSKFTIHAELMWDDIDSIAMAHEDILDSLSIGLITRRGNLYGFELLDESRENDYDRLRASFMELIETLRMTIPEKLYVGEIEPVE